VFRIEIPPLRSRIEDLDDLVPMLVTEYNVAAGKRVRTIPEEAWAVLRAHHWPGNVRELRNAIERSVLLADGESLPVEWLQLGDPSPTGPASMPKAVGDSLCVPLDGSMTLDEMERAILEEALARSRFNVTAAARILGTTRQTLRYRIEKYGIEIPDPD
jgi:DNA-binding NtrC family response regulator